MPDGLPDVALEIIHGRFTDEQRKGVFKPEVRVRADASPQDKLLAYTGRNPRLYLSYPAGPDRCGGDPSFRRR